MKTTIALCVAVLSLFAVASQVHAEIIAGPLTNPANGHDYYLLAPSFWSLAQAEAESLGGTLAVIKNEDEQKWVLSTFGTYGGVNRDLWIGLHRNAANEFVWVTGAPTNYLNWGPHQPDNAGGAETAVHIWMPGSNVEGYWNDSPEDSLFCGVVELPGKADSINLSKTARALTGTWYEGGNADRPCWITATDNLLFVIPNNRVASRAGVSTDGSLLFATTFLSDRTNPSRLADGIRGRTGISSPTGLRAEIIKDKILWNSGIWWSRKPTADTKKETASVKDE